MFNTIAVLQSPSRMPHLLGLVPHLLTSNSLILGLVALHGYILILEAETDSGFKKLIES